MLNDIIWFHQASKEYMKCNKIRFYYFYPIALIRFLLVMKKDRKRMKVQM